MMIDEWKEMLYRQENTVMAIGCVTLLFALFWFTYPQYRRWLQWLPVLLTVGALVLPFVSRAVTH